MDRKPERPEPTIIKRKNSSFASTSSPWFRRNSFLSQSMIDDEESSVYELHSFFPDAQPYNIISLRECQGFVFNQDLFATPYQQLRLLAREKRIRAMSFSRSKSKSRSNSASCSSSPKPTARRHTLADVRPTFRSLAPAHVVDSRHHESAIDDDSMEIDTINSTADGIPDESDEDDENEYGLSLSHRVQVTDIILLDDEKSYLPS